MRHIATHGPGDRRNACGDLFRVLGPCPRRAQGVDGEVTKIKGTATAKNLMKPGQLTLHLDGTPESFGAPYWIVALGNENGVSRATLIFHRFG